MAAHARGGDEGCFQTGNILAQLPFGLQFRNADQKIVTIACFLPLLRRFADDPDLLHLFLHARVLQEQVTSSARLIYSGEQVH
jgi:hypothetical protein